MNSKSFKTVLAIARGFFDEGDLEACIQTLLNARLNLDAFDEWNELLPLLEQMPNNFLSQNDDGALLYVKALRCLRKHEVVVEWVSQNLGDTSRVKVMLECAASLNGLQRYLEARDLLEEIIPKLSGEDLGTAWARFGFTSFNLQEPWEEAYLKALPLLDGEERGRALLNYGYCLSMFRRYEDASQVWLEALSCFKRNAYFTVWIRHNLATIAMNNLEPQAERHLLGAVRDLQNPKARQLESAVWEGLARFRRAVGEWARAEFAFRQALASAQVAAEKQAAYRGLARLHYLSGLFDQALETLEVALHEPDVPHFLLYVVQAKVYLKLGQTNKAKAVLEKAGEPKFELEKWPWSIAAAELARQEGRFDEAVTLLEGLPLNNVDARADVRQFPLLFELLHGAGKPVPEPLEYVQGTTITVQAQGVLHVSVNGRKVDIIPAGRVGELLVFLLEQGGQASLEAIGDALYPDVTEAKRRRQAVWKLVDKLRETLGWQDAVLSLRGAYQLDPKATWHYDIAEARRRKEFGGEFLAGVYSEWALEVGRELQELGPGGRRLLN